jgi:LysR family glycine cleavage system transcriptional activator
MRAFEAAARHLSFTKAAKELSVTPAAVSQQVKLLEEYYGVRLFRRLTRALRLTDAGQAALPALREGFEKLSEGARRLSSHDRSGFVTVSVAPSFGAKWLVPRLHRFHDAHPEFDIRIDATDALVNFDAEGVDVALRYGRGLYEGLRADCLMSEVSVPVCSPALLRGPNGLRSPDDLRRHTLLHVQWKMEDAAAPNWRMWLRAAGVEHVEAERGPRFSMDSMALEAAIEGQGVALVGMALVERDLKAGRLVRPFAPPVNQATTFGYYLVYPETMADNPKVAAFRSWVLKEVKRSSEGTDGIETSSPS